MVTENEEEGDFWCSVIVNGCTVPGTVDFFVRLSAFTQGGRGNGGRQRAREGISPGETQLVSSCNCASDSRSFLRATVHSE